MFDKIVFKDIIFDQFTECICYFWHFFEKVVSNTPHAVENDGQPDTDY